MSSSSKALSYAKRICGHLYNDSLYTEWLDNIPTDFETGRVDFDPESAVALMLDRLIDCLTFRQEEFEEKQQLESMGAPDEQETFSSAIYGTSSNMCGKHNGRLSAIWLPIGGVLAISMTFLLSWIMLAKDLHTVDCRRHQSHCYWQKYLLSTIQMRTRPAMHA